MRPIAVLQQIESVAHSPTLNTVLMVEKTLMDAKEMLSIAELKRRLPRKVMHSTLLAILDYLQWSGKVVFSSKGVVWIYSPPPQLAKLKEGALEL